jgi:hypothetical protein
MVRSKTNTIHRCHDKPYKANTSHTKLNTLSILINSPSSTTTSTSSSSSTESHKITPQVQSHLTHGSSQCSSSSSSSPLKHWQCLVTDCVGWMKNKIISTLDLVLNQNEPNQFSEYSSSPLLLLETGTTPQSQLITTYSSPFHFLPIDVLAGTLIRFIPMSDVGNLKLCSKSCCELFEIAARNSSLLLLNCRPILVGPFSHRCQYTLPSQPNSSYLPILWTLRHFISLISKQTQTINYQYLSSHQSMAILGPTQYLDEQMRASVIDWMIEVSVEFKCVPSILHYSVQILDQVLSHVSIPRRFFQLLGCVCLYLMSRPTSYTIMMDLDDVMYMCDSQYTVDEVNGMIEFVERHLDDHAHRLLVASLEQQTQIPISSFLSSSSTPSPSSHPPSSFFSIDPHSPTPLPVYSPLLTLPSFKISLNSPTMIHFLASICNALHLPLVMYQCIEINSSIYSNPGPTESDPTPTPSTAEHILLSIFLSDLSLLDYHLLQYSPFTIACAVICLTRLTLYYYGESQVLLTPYGLADGRSREIKQLLKSVSLSSLSLIPCLLTLFVEKISIDCISSLIPTTSTSPSA